MNIISTLPPLLIHFITTVALSFMVGLELHSYQRANDYTVSFGTTRTFMLIGILGFVLFSLDNHYLPFTIGLLLLGILLMLFYWRSTKKEHFSLMAILLALATYTIGPVTSRFPGWFLILFVVVLILLLGEKPKIRRLSDRISNEEMVTLAKFLIMSGIILPLLPDSQIAPMVTVTYYKVWLAVIVVSGISYISYLAQTYFFQLQGLLLTGILGGLYSSTAATVVIGQRARDTAYEHVVSSAIIMATSMMYLRLLVIVFIFNKSAASYLLLPFLTAFALSCIVALGLLRWNNHNAPTGDTAPIRHPLELKTALVFAFLFVFFASLTHYVVSDYGTKGLHILAFATGFTDIDPFILSVLAGKYNVSMESIIAAIIIASGSNNLLKGVYAIVLARNRSVMPAVLWLILLFAASLLYAFWVTG
jgi:uncharacterized membrane protein (DUF4010 family)